MTRQNVLILCTANSARSQMAEALLRHKAADRFEVYSAGVKPAIVNPFAIKVIEEKGISMVGHRSKHLDEFFGKIEMAYLITVCGNAEENCPVWPGLTKRIHMPFEDPAACEGSDEDRLNKFRQVREQIDAKLDEWLASIPA